jgi:uncharacterized membrane protein YvlD (DUF360 family)
METLIKGFFDLCVYCAVFILPARGLVHDFYEAFYLAFMLAFFAALLNEILQVLKDIRDK